MSISDIPLMKAMAAKMDWLSQRQTILAQNMANADTPGYQSKDLSEADFGSVLKQMSSGGITMAKTQSGHVPNSSRQETTKNQADRWSYEVSPDKNGVIMEEQMVKATKTQMDFSMLTSLMAKQSSMYKTALGRQG